jgi:hopene-associated glycosyltransferase HpnB
MLLIAIAAVPLAIWTYLAAIRCRFPGIVQPKHAPTTKRMVAVVPARNEVEVIGQAVTSLLQQAALTHLVLVDDASTDGTADAARAAALATHSADRLSIVASDSLPAGWTGKLWAVSQGIAVAKTFAPDYILLTDADIEHGPGTLTSLLAMAEARGCDLTSYMVKLACETWPEKALIPAFVFFFFLLYPPRAIADPDCKIAGAAGGCMLIRPEALNRIGGIAAIRNEVIDDCALARAVKRTGGRIWLGLTNETRSIRSYGSFRDIGQMISRTAFNQLHHSAALLVLTVAGLFATYIFPIGLLFSGHRIPALMGLAAWILMSASYARMIRYYRLSLLWSFALPAIAAFYASATVHSALQYWRGSGGHWKGRAQDLRA